VQDESLIDEMRAALKGDRERAEQRRQSAAPAPRAEPQDPPQEAPPARKGLLARLGLRRS
jgi:hypothetical protein